MAELKEVFEMVTKQTEPDLDSWREQERRQRRTARNRRMGAIALVAAIVGALVIATLTLPDKDLTKDTGTDPSPAHDSLPDGSIGAQIVGLDGTVVGRILGLPPGSSALEMSPDGRTIAFVMSDRVATIGIDGSGLRIVSGAVTNSGGDAHEAVAWSPDGRFLAYVDDDDIQIVGADGFLPLPLVRKPGGQYFPVWSSAGAIAFWDGRTTGEDGGPSNAEIYTVSADGGVPRRITRNGISDIEPAWSPDGRRLAFWHGGDLMLARSDGSRGRVVYRGDGGAWAPAWSPDGRRIAFLSYDESERSISDRPLLKVLVLDLETREITDLGMRVETDLNGPSWTPDGNLLINRYD
jgi:Tol biopolymer transport system component